MEFDWLDTPFDLHAVPPKEIEESFEDPFSLRLLPEGIEDDSKARFFNLGKTLGDRGIFSLFWTDGKRYRVILARDMTPEEQTVYDRNNSEAF
ncbi:MAG: BrnT family toxin [Chthoniobacteraceae bacterium]